MKASWSPIRNQRVRDRCRYPDGKSRFGRVVGAGKWRGYALIDWDTGLVQQFPLFLLEPVSAPLMRRTS